MAIHKKTMVITGGAGFIGTNATRAFLRKGWNVIIIDNFSRRGTEVNTKLLKKDFKKGLTIIRCDITKEQRKLQQAIEKADAVLHLAAQVAVTTSIIDPRADMETNILGTFNVLEAVRLSKSRPAVIYSSTNKVYGALEHLSVKEGKERYVFTSRNHAKYGISEKEQLDFHSPYGCSKGSADQYVIDYGRIYGLDTVVFRQSCIYGRHQFGVEDQGWVAWFTIAAILGKKITIYGNGKQVRDLLYVDDLVELYDLAFKHMQVVRGKAYNVGGGPKNTLSLIELFELLKKELGTGISVAKAATRAGDQPIFIADIRRLKKELGWEPKWNIKKGWSSMYEWVREHEGDIHSALA